MEPPQILDHHAQEKENNCQTPSVKINGVEDDDDSRMLRTNDSRLIPEGTSSLEGGSDDKKPKEDHGSSVIDEKINEEELKAEKICRICHLGSDHELSSAGSSEELIQLGCQCRGELGISHRSCAETWFKRRGNRLCEICNKTAKNVRVNKDVSIYIRDYREITPMAVAAGYDPPIESSRRCKRFCNIFLACLIAGFIVSTFLRVKLF